MNAPYILPSFYLPSTEYFILLAHEGAAISTREIYIKQTLRNRCLILSPNGIQVLTVPVIHTGSRQITGEVRISYSEPWQRQHLRSMKTAYSRSPFFEFFYDDLERLLMQPYEYLHELNEEMLRMVLHNGRFRRIQFRTSSESVNSFPGKTKDNTPVYVNSFARYNQVFSYKSGFVRNLSIIDLLCNTGLQAESLLLTETGN